MSLLNRRLTSRLDRADSRVLGALSLCGRRFDNIFLPPEFASFAEPPQASSEHKELAVWSEEQLHAFLDNVRGDRLYPLWRFCGHDRLSQRRGTGADLARPRRRVRFGRDQAGPCADQRRSRAKPSPRPGGTTTHRPGRRDGGSTARRPGPPHSPPNSRSPRMGGSTAAGSSTQDKR